MSSALARTADLDVESKTPSTRTQRRIKELPNYDGSTRPVQGSDWMVHVRDHGIDITMIQWGLATLYGTYGNWGKKAYPSDNWVAKRFHVKPQTISNARKSLLAKGLIRCIGTVPGQPNQFVYCLTLPVEVGGSSGDPLSEGVTPETAYGTPPNGIRVTPQTAYGYPPNGDQDLQDLDPELETTTQPGSARDDGEEEQESQRQTQAPAGPGHAPSGDEDEPVFDWDDPDDGGLLAAELGVPVSTIGKSFRVWLESIYNETPFMVVLYAAQDSNGKRNPVGYFKSILPVYAADYESLGGPAFQAKYRP